MTTSGDSEEGLGLIELIVGILVSSVVMVGVAVVLINSWLAQEDVTTTSAATTRGQLIASNIERAVRNGLDFKIEGAGGTELWVWTSLDGAQRCQGFRLGGGEARWSATTGPLAASTTWPSWEQDAVQRVGGTGPLPVFMETDPGKTVTYAFDIETESAPVRFDGEVSVRSIQGGTNPCWS